MWKEGAKRCAETSMLMHQLMDCMYGDFDESHRFNHPWFNGVRLEVSTALSFEAVLQRLHENCGKSAVPQINEAAVSSASADQFSRTCLSSSFCSH